ncbi:MAG: hypothetical protein ABL921_10035, partial [Pirellula sp.]
QGHQIFDNRGVGGSVSTLASAAIGAAFTMTNSEVRALVIDADLHATAGMVTVLADTFSEIDSFGLGLTASGLAGLGGSLSVNVLTNSTQAVISGGSSIDSQGNLLVKATEHSSVNADSAALAVTLGIVGVGAGLGLSVAGNVITNTVRAKLEDTTVSDAAAVEIVATSQLNIDAVTRVGAGSLAPGLIVGIAFAGAGSGAINSVHNTTEALIVDSTMVDSMVGVVNVEALDDNDIAADAGSFALSLGSGPVAAAGISIAAAIALNDVGNTTRAAIRGSSLPSTGAVTVDSETTGSVTAFSLGLAGAMSASQIVAVTFAGAGSGAGNRVANTVESMVETSTLAPNGALEVVALDSLVIKSDAGAGALAIGGGGIASVGIGVGISVAGNLVDNTVRSAIDSSTVEGADSVLVDSKSMANIYAITGAGVAAVSAGGLVSVAFGGAASGSGNMVTNTIEALILDSSSVTGTVGAVTVQALDDATIEADAGSGVLTVGASAAISAGVGLAAAAAVNDVANTTRAAVNNSTIDDATALSVLANSTPNVEANAFGIAGVLSAGGLIGVGFSAAGAGGLNHINSKIEAKIQGSTVTNVGGVTVNAVDHSSIMVDVSGASIGVSAGTLTVNVSIGGSVAENQISNETTALIDDSNVSTSGNIQVTASSDADIDADAVGTSLSASAGGLLALNVAVVGAVTLNTITNTTIAEIRGSGDELAETFTATNSILVQATDDSTVTATTNAASVAVSGSFGISGSLNFAVSLSTNDIGNETRAIIDESPVHSTTSTISVLADSNTDIDAFAFALQLNVAVGLVAVAGGAVGAATLNTVQNTTEAVIRNSGDGPLAQVQAPGLILVHATDDALITADTGTTSIQFSAGAVSGNVSLTASLATNDIANTTRALIDDSSVQSTSNAIHVLADSNVDIDALAVAFSFSASVGGISILAGVIGAVTLNTIGGTTEAVVRNSGDLAGEHVQAQLDVLVDADDASLILADTATASISIGGGFLAVGVSAAINLATNDMTSTTRALIENSRVQSTTGSVTVDATSISNINVSAFGIGIAGTGGAASITAEVVGATALNSVHNTIEAFVRNSETAQGQGLTAADAITITALDNTTIHSDAIAGSVSADAAFVSLGLNLTVAGSTNEIGNTVRSGIESSNVESTTENVAVLAKTTSTITVTSTAATLSVSFAPFGFEVAASGAFAENNTTSTIEAYIRDGSVVLGRETLSAPDGVSVNAIDIASIGSSVLGASFSIAASGAALGISGSTSTVDDTVRASIEASTVTAVTGDLTVRADANQHVIANALAAGASFGVGAAISGAVALTEINSDVEAFANASTLNVNAAAGVLAVQATSDLYADADANGFAGGFGLAALAVARPTAEIGGATRSWVSGNTTTNSRTFNVLANSISLADADTVSIGVGIVGVAAAASSGLSTVSRATEAYMGTRAGSVPGAPAIIGAVSAEVQVKATSNSDALVDAEGGALGPGIVISGFLGEANITGSTIAYIGEGVTLNAGELDVLADADETADVLTIAVGAGAISGQGAKATGLIDSNTEAFIGTRAGSTPSANPTTTVNIVLPGANPAADGTVLVDALSHQVVDADSKGGGLAAINVAIMLPEATAGGKVRAYVGEGTQLTAVSLTITANAPTMNADATAFAIGISAIGGANVLQSKTTVSGEVEAFIGAQFASGASTSKADIDVGAGQVTVQADSSMRAHAIADSGSASAGLALAFLTPESKITGKTRAYVRDGVDLDANSLVVRAGEAGVDTVKYEAIAESLVLGLGLAGGAVITAPASITGSVEAFVGAPAGLAPGGDPNANISISTVLDIDAASDMDATSEADGASAALTVTVGIMRPHADVNGTTRASIGQGVDISATGADVRADGDYTANATTISVQIGLTGAVTGAEAEAFITGTVDAHIGSASGTTPSSDLSIVGVGGGQVNVNAAAKMTATPTIFSFGAGAASVSALFPTATIDGKVRAYVGEGVDIDAGGLMVKASAPILHAQAHALGIGFGGLLDLGVFKSIATTSAVVESFIGANAGINASNVTTDIHVGGGTVSVVTETEMQATADADSGGFSGVVAFGVMHPIATVSGKARSYVRDGVDLDASSLTIQAGSLSTNRIIQKATAQSTVVKFAGLAAGAIIDADATTDGTVEAFIGAATGRVAGGAPGARIQLAGDLRVESASDIDAFANTFGGSLAIGAGVNVMKPTANAGGTTRSYAGGGTAVRVNKLELDADGDVYAEAHTLAIAVGGIGAVNIVEAQAMVTSNVEAFVGKEHDSGLTDLGSVDILTIAGARGVLDLDATSKSEAKAVADGGAVALIAINSNHPTATLAGATRAYIGPYTDVFAATVTADAVEDTARARAETFAGAIGLGAVTDMIADARAERKTEAFLGHHGMLDLGSGSATFIADATPSTPMADAASLGVAGGSIFSISKYQTFATIGPNSVSRAYVGNNATVDAGTLTLQATSNTTAKADARFVGISGFVDAQEGTTEATNGQDTESYIGDDATITLSGALNMHANNTPLATPTISSVSLAGAVSLSFMTARTTLDGDTGAWIGNGSTVDVLSIDIDATATHVANADINSVGFGVGLGAGVITAEAKDTGSSFVRLGPANGDPGSSGNRTVITASGIGGIQADATMDSRIKSEPNFTGLSLIAAASFSNAFSTQQSAARADVGAWADVSSDLGDVHIGATFIGDSRAQASSASVGGLVGVAKAIAKASFSPSVDIAVGSNADLASHGVARKVELLAQQNHGLSGFSATDGARASASNVNFAGVVAVSHSNVDAVANAQVNTIVGSSANLIAPDGNVIVSSLSSNTSLASLNSLGGSLIVSVDNGTANSQAKGRTNTEFLGNVADGGAIGANSLQVFSKAYTTADSTLTSIGGATVKVSNGSANSTALPELALTFGGGSSTIRVGGDITVEAVQNSDADAKAKGASGGLVRVSDFTSTAHVLRPGDDTPEPEDDRSTVQLHVGDVDNVTAGGTLTILAQHGAEPAPISDGTFTSVDGSEPSPGDHVPGNTNFIQFDLPPQLQDGAVITSQTGVGGLEVDRSYSVIKRTDPNSIHIGESFTSSQIDLNTDEIRFGFLDPETNVFSPTRHNLRDNDLVWYFDNNLAPVGGLETGKQYRVSVVNDAAIKLQDPLDIDGTVNVPAGADITTDLTGGLIDSANTFENGDPVTYRARSPEFFTSAFVDAEIDGDGFDSIDNNEIYLENHGWSDGQELVYHVSPGPGAGAAVGLNIAGPGLVDGQHIWVIVLDGDRIQLAASALDANNGDELDLFPDKVSDNGRISLHSLRRVAHESLNGLVEGNVYFVSDRTGTSFRLKDGIGNYVFFNDTGRSGGEHVFQVEGVNLTSAGGSSTGVSHLLVLDLNSTNTDGKFSGIGGASAVAGAPSGDRQATASTTGVGGGFVDVSEASATSSMTVSTNLSIASQAQLFANNIDVRTDSYISVKAVSDGQGGGFVSVGEADTTASAKHYSTIDVGTNAVLTANNNLTIRSSGNSVVNSDATTGNGGFIGVATATADAFLEYQTQNLVNGDLTAGNALVVDAHTSGNVLADAETDTGGLGADGESFADAIVGDGNENKALTRTEIRGSADLQGNVITIAAMVDDLTVRAHAETDVTAAGADCDANAEDARITSQNEVLILNGSELIGNQSIAIDSKYLNVNLTAVSDSDLDALGGDTDSFSKTLLDTRAKVEGIFGSLLRTASLVVTAQQDSVVSQAESPRDGAVFDGGDSDNSETKNARREIFWESLVVLLGEPNPELEVDANGAIVQLTNVTVTDQFGNPYVLGQTLDPGDEIVVGDIENNSPASVVFFANEVSDAPEGAIWGNQGKFELQHTWDYVHITNHSNRLLRTNLIDVVDGGTVIDVRVDSIPGWTDPDSALDANAVGNTFEFDLEHTFPETQVEIQNLNNAVSSSNIIIDGRIENPIGHTLINNVRGNILTDTDGDVEVIRTNELELNANGGSIGAQTPSRNALWVELIRYENKSPLGTYNDIEVSVIATGDIVLDLTANRRTSELGAFTIPVDVLRAGDDIDVVVNDSKRGDDAGSIADIVVNLFNPPSNDNIDSAGGGTMSGTLGDAQSGVYLTHFRPDAPDPGLLAIIKAFGTITTEIDSTYVIDEVRAGDDLEIGHLSTTPPFGEPRIYATTERADGNPPWAVNPDTPDRVVNFVFDADIDWDGGSSEDGIEQIFLTTNGDINVIELNGDLQVGHIHSTGGNVTLVSGRKILDADGNPSIDVTGVNITMTSGVATPEDATPDVGGIGLLNDYLEINVDRNHDVAPGVLNAFDNNAAVNGGIYISELISHLHVDTVHSKADVSLRTVGGSGSILDSRNGGAGDTTANVLGQTIDLDANGNGADLGAPNNDLEIDSRIGSAFGQDDVGLEATEHIYLTETDGNLRLVLAHAYLGDIRLTVRDSAVQGENFELLPSGEARFAENNSTVPGNHIDADRMVPIGQVFAEAGAVTLRVGDNITLDPHSQIIAARAIDIFGDINATDATISAIDPDTDFGTNMVLRGRIIAGATLTTAGSQVGGNPVGAAQSTVATGPVYRTEIWGNNDVDTFQFGDSSGIVGTTTFGIDGYIFLGSKTRVHGSQDLPSTGNDGEDRFNVYYLQDMTVTTASANGIAGAPIIADHTLTLDGQADTDYFAIYTTGSRGNARNYVINVLDTGEEDDGVDELTIYGFDQTSPSFIGNVPGSSTLKQPND